MTKAPEQDTDADEAPESEEESTIVLEAYIDLWPANPASLN